MDGNTTLIAMFIAFLLVGPVMLLCSTSPLNIVPMATCVQECRACRAALLEVPFKFKHCFRGNVCPGVHGGPWGGHEALLCGGGQQREDLRHLPGRGAGKEGAEWPALWHPGELQPLLLPALHPQVALPEAVRENHCQVGVDRFYIALFSMGGVPGK